MMRDLTTLFANRYKVVRAADRAIQHHGFRVMLLLRLCPIVPFNGLNYIGGVTAVSADDFAAALVGTLPLIVLTVVAGATAESLSDHVESTKERMWRHCLMLMGLLFVFGAVCITLYKAKKEFVKLLAAERDEAESAEDLVASEAQAIKENQLPSTRSVFERIELLLWDDEGDDDQDVEYFYPS
jgi:hypothetical protein